MVAAGRPVARSKTVIGEGGVPPLLLRGSCASTSLLPSAENARADDSKYSADLSRIFSRATFWSTTSRSQRTKISVGGLPTPAPRLYLISGGISPSRRLPTE